jgi:STE24 endopeptidase
MTSSPLARLLVVAFVAWGASARAEEAPQAGLQPLTLMPSVITVPPEAQPSDHFDAQAATEAYLAQIPAAAREKSDAYFEGGYWLTLIDFLFSVAMYWALLRFRISARMRDTAEKLARFRVLQTALYWLQLMIATALIGFPLSWYEGYYREHEYGLSTHTFGAWTLDQLKGLGLGIVLGGIVVGVLLAIVRRLPRTWHVWGAVVTVAFMAFGIMTVPVVILPVFNTSKPLADPRITDPIISLARANGIAIDNVYEVDASKQTTRMSANVSGLGSTLRVTLNDNLLKRGSLEEIEAIMGHEMGHYVLNHIPKAILFFFVVIAVGFALLRLGLDRSVARWGAAWGLRDAMDVAALPLVFLLASIFFFVLTPILNTQTRTAEQEADMYGLNASRQPDGFAQAAIHLGEYRKMSPGPLEEWVFFDHPSGRNRIFNAMRWKAQNLALFAPKP